MAGKPWHEFKEFSNRLPDYYSTLATHWVKAFDPSPPSDLPYWIKGMMALVDGDVVHIRDVFRSGPTVFVGIQGYEKIENVPLASVSLVLDHSHVDPWEDPWIVPACPLPAFDVLKKIIGERRIYYSLPISGKIKGLQCAVCFSETPISTMASVFKRIEKDGFLEGFVKWQPYGLAFSKPVLYKRLGARPVLHVSDLEYKEMCDEKYRFSKLKELFDRSLRDLGLEERQICRISEVLLSASLPQIPKWRAVAFEMELNSATDWTHEREWRSPDSVNLGELHGDERPVAIVKTANERHELRQLFAVGSADCPIIEAICLEDFSQ